MCSNILWMRDFKERICFVDNPNRGTVYGGRENKSDSYQ